MISLIIYLKQKSHGSPAELPFSGQLHCVSKRDPDIIDCR